MNLLNQDRIPENASRFSFRPACEIPCINTTGALSSPHPCEDQYRLLFANNPNPMWVFEETTLGFLEVNQAACALYGYTREEFLSMKIFDIHPAVEIPGLLASVVRSEGRAKPAGVWKHTRLNGTVIYAQISGIQTQYEGKPAALAIIHDVSELIRVEQELHQTRKELESRVRERTEELESANAELRKEIANKQRLERRILEVSENEQRKLGEDLHDDLGQQLTGMGLLASVLANDLRKQENPLAEEAQSLVNYLGEASMCARNLAKGLYPVALDRGGFLVALNQLASRISKTSNVVCELKFEESFKLIDGSAIQFYRIIQEAVNNAIKHGKARHIEIECKTIKNALTLVIRNDGIPFHEPQRSSKGMGLSLMRHRARMIGAHLVIRRGREGGCETICSIPKPRQRSKSRPKHKLPKKA